MSEHTWWVSYRCTRREGGGSAPVGGGGGLYSSTPSPTGEHPQATLESGQTQLHVKSLTTVEINILQEEQ